MPTTKRKTKNRGKKPTKTRAKRPAADPPARVLPGDSLGLTVEDLAIDAIAGNDENPRRALTPDDPQWAVIRDSIRAYGLVDPLIFNRRTERLVGGHQRLAILRAEFPDRTTAPCVIVDLDEHDERGLSVVLNKAGGDWDRTRLAATLSAIRAERPEDLSLTGFDRTEIAAILAEIPAGGETVDPDALPDPDENAVTEPGDLWQLGDHRLLCGDATNEHDMARLTEGANVAAAITSPPYAEQRKQQYGGVPASEYVDWFEAVQANVRAALAGSGWFLINIMPHSEDGGMSTYVLELVLAMVRWGWTWRDEYCWVKGGSPKRVRYRFKAGWESVYALAAGEPDWFPESVRHQTDNAVSTIDGFPGGGGNMGAAQGRGRPIPRENRPGLAYPDNVIEVKGRDPIVGHPAVFPVRLVSFFIRAYSEAGGVWLDPFSGAGTTIIACQQLDRVGLGLEIKPGYCDIAVRRWQQLTGKTATRTDRNGRSRKGSIL